MGYIPTEFERGLGSTGTSEADQPHVEPYYRSWSALAGYFDGDGTVEFSVRKFRIDIRLAFDANWKPFLDGVREFLLSKRIIPGSVRRKMQSKTWHIVTARVESVRRMARAMKPYSVKKRLELQTVLDYVNGRISGAEFVQVMNQEVRQGQRTGKIRPGGPPNKRRRAPKFNAKRNSVRARLLRPLAASQIMLPGEAPQEEDKNRPRQALFVGR